MAARKAEGGLELPQMEAQGGVDAVVHPVAEGDFQLAGHADVPADGQQIVRYRLFDKGELDRKAYKGVSGGFGSYAQRDPSKHMV